MAKKSFEVVIAADGQVTIEVKGHPGHACMDVVEGMRKALGGAEIKDKKVTAEYHQQGGSSGTNLQAGR